MEEKRRKSRRQRARGSDGGKRKEARELLRAGGKEQVKKT